jgi:hypothetical protein
MSTRAFRSFNELRRELRGSASWQSHIDEIAEQTGRHEPDDEPVSLFDRTDDLDTEDLD